MAAHARESGADVSGLVYDTLLEDDGRRHLYLPLFNLTRSCSMQASDRVATDFG
jgi:hypothetical protein